MKRFHTKRSSSHGLALLYGLHIQKKFSEGFYPGARKHWQSSQRLRFPAINTDSRRTSRAIFEQYKCKIFINEAYLCAVTALRNDQKNSL